MALVRLLLGVPRDRIELWHHEVDESQISRSPSIFMALLIGASNGGQVTPRVSVQRHGLVLHF